jgi:hypothetical protein
MSVYASYLDYQVLRATFMRCGHSTSSARMGQFRA